MSENTRQKAIEREGRLVLAINALKKGQITKICQAARLYDVPLSTLHDCLHSHTDQASTCANGLQLSKTKEELLKK
jgi:predicted HTH domain antitoxin